MEGRPFLIYTLIHMINLTIFVQKTLAFGENAIFKKGIIAFNQKKT